MFRNLVKWRTNVRDFLDIGKAKKAVDLPVIGEEKKTELKKVKDGSDEEDSDDLELEEQIKEALDAEKKIEKKCENIIYYIIQIQKYLLLNYVK